MSHAGNSPQKGAAATATLNGLRTAYQGRQAHCVKDQGAKSPDTHTPTEGRRDGAMVAGRSAHVAQQADSTAAQPTEMWNTVQRPDRHPSNGPANRNRTRVVSRCTENTRHDPRSQDNEANFRGCERTEINQRSLTWEVNKQPTTETPEKPKMYSNKVFCTMLKVKGKKSPGTVKPT